MLIITFWNFDTKKAVEKLDGANDFLLGWDNTPDLKRYCHLYSDEEMTDIKKGLAGKLEKYGVAGQIKKNLLYLEF